MSTKVRVLSTVHLEITEAFKYYESESQGLGDSFLLDLDKKLENIFHFPLMHPERIGSIRRALLHKFPYAIFYRHKPDESIVVGIRNTKRNPAKLREEDF